MKITLLVVVSVVCGLSHTCLGLNAVPHFTIHESHVSPPMPSQNAVDCLTQLSPRLMECRNHSLKTWSVTDYSPLADVCCAQWDVFECDLDQVAKSKCSNDEMDEVNDYFDNLIDFYNEKTCRPFPRGSTHCVLPILAQVARDRPPMPGPLVVDCLTTIKPEVRLNCFEAVVRKWNISRKGTPVKNLCCATWDDIDCLDQVVRVRCPQSEVDLTEQYWKKLENWTAGEACKAWSYHSANCTLPKTHVNRKEVVNVAQLEDESYVPFVFPAKAEPAAAAQPLTEVNHDYRDFLMEYIITVFPHLLNLLVLLTVVLVAVIVIQCFLIGRQLKREQHFSATKTVGNKGYHRVNV